MNIYEAIKVCEDIQAWRRGNGNEQPHSPKVYGEALDVLIQSAKERIKLFDALKLYTQ